MFNLRRRIATGYLIHLWKRETRMVVVPFSSSSSYAAENPNRQITTPAFIMTSPAVAEKSCIFGKLQPFVGETLDFITREEEKKGVSVTKEDLVKWAKQLKKDGKFEHAYEVLSLNS